MDRLGRETQRRQCVMLLQLLGTAFVCMGRLAVSPHQKRQENRLAFRAAMKSVRRELRQVSGRALRRLFAHEQVLTRLDPAEIRSVVICRINGRLGNTLLLTPLIKHIRDNLPNATIDLALAYPRAAELLRDVPGVRRIIVFPYRTSQVILRYLTAVRSLRRERYDLAIDPAPDSTSGRVALMLCHARYRLGFDTASQWVPLSHPVGLPDELMHDGVRPVFLLTQALQTKVDPASVRLWLPLQTSELDAGRVAIAQAMRATHPGQGIAQAFGFFAQGAGGKTIGRGWWREFWQAFLELEPQTVPVQFLPLSATAPIDSHFPVVHIHSPRAMIGAIAATRMFIAPDTGPMHLASTTSVPTVALFRDSNVARYRPMKSSDLTIDVTQYAPRGVADLCRRIWMEERLRVAAYAAGSQLRVD